MIHPATFFAIGTVYISIQYLLRDLKGGVLFWNIILLNHIYLYDYKPCPVICLIFEY